MFGKLEKIYWITKNALTEQRQGEIDSCFEPQIDYFGAADEFKLKKTFDDLKNIFLEKVEKIKLYAMKRTAWGENIKRDSIIVLDDVNGLADLSPSFVTFLTVCRKYGCVS